MPVVFKKMQMQMQIQTQTQVKASQTRATSAVIRTQKSVMTGSMLKSSMVTRIAGAKSGCACG